MSDLKYKLADIIKDANSLYQFEGIVFNRKFDNKFKDIDDFISYFKKATIYLIYGENELIGYFAFDDISPTENELMAIAIFPKFQGKGLASHIIKYYLDLNAGKTSKLITHPKNTKAIILYLRNGFEITSWEENHFGDGQPRLILKRSFI